MVVRAVLVACWVLVVVPWDLEAGPMALADQALVKLQATLLAVRMVELLDLEVVQQDLVVCLDQVADSRAQVELLGGWVVDLQDQVVEVQKVP